MLIDLSCPIELLSFEIMHDDRLNTRAYLTLNNLSQDWVDGFDAVIRWSHSASGRKLDAAFSADRLHAAGGASFTVPLSTDQLPGADGLQLLIQRVRLDSGEVWQGDPARLIEYAERPEPDGRLLNRLIEEAGEDVVCLPSERAEGWVCVCGRLNPSTRAQCARCGRDRAQVFRRFSRQALTSQAIPGRTPSAPARPPRPNRRQQQEALRRQFVRQRNLLIRRTITLIALAALIAVAAFWVSSLAERRDEAKEFIPPTRMENSVQYPPAHTSI